jgi:hypothetical protein
VPPDRVRRLRGCARIACAAILVAQLTPRAWAGQQGDSQQGGESAVPGVGAILRQIPADFWHFLSPQSAVVLGIGAGAALDGHTWDDDLAGEVETNVRLNNALSPGNTYGAFSFQVTIGIGAYGFGRWLGGDRLAIFGADVIRAQVLGQAWAQVLKFTVQRERPDASNDLSFPSGHSASGFATAAVAAQHFGWRVGVPAYLLAAYVATARVHDNKHYLSDVIFGAAMGIASQQTVARYPLGRRIAVLPAVSGTSAAVVVRIVPGR